MYIVLIKFLHAHLEYPLYILFKLLNVICVIKLLIYFVILKMDTIHKKMHPQNMYL